jgi:hypothetical protein
MTKDYKSSKDFFVKEINSTTLNSYMFVGSPFSKGGDYRVDIMRHLDFRTKNSPEYTITIRKVRKDAPGEIETPLSKVKKNFGGLGSEINLRGHGKRMKGQEGAWIDRYADKNLTYEKSEVLNCSQSTA